MRCLFRIVTSLSLGVVTAVTLTAMTIGAGRQAAAETAESLGSPERVVVALVFDGIPGALIDSVATPAFDRIQLEGVWTHDWTPVFPTTSLPNWVSLSTGCWPERHGIVGNGFHIGGEPVSFREARNPDLLLACEHIHEVAERQGVRAATLAWVGGYSPERGELASVTQPLTSEILAGADDAQASRVIEQLRRTDPEYPRLILGYFGGPDETSHELGMEAEETRAAMARSDAALGRILAAIDELQGTRDVSLLVTTDHGNRDVSKLINLPVVLDRAELEAEVEIDGAIAFVYLDDPASAPAAASALAGREDFDVVRPAGQPADWHLGTNERVGQLILVARPPHFFAKAEDMPWGTRWLQSTGPETVPVPSFLKRVAMHGYPANQPEMKGIFYAWGSGIRKGHRISGGRAVDLHPTIAALLSISSGSPLDGRLLAEIFDY